MRGKIEAGKTNAINAQFHKAGFDKINDLESKLKDAKRRYNEMQTEVNAMHRIQNEQSKALQNIGVQKNYPGKIRELINELRDLKDKNKL